MKNPRALLLVTFLLLAAPAMGQVGNANQEKADNIRRLLTIVGAEKLQQGMIDQMLPVLKSIIGGSLQGDPQAQKVFDRMTQLMLEEFKKIDMTRVSAELYDKYFTNEDIKGMIQFYESPVGQKTIQVLPTLTQESMTRGIELGQSAAQRAIERLSDEFPQLKSLKDPAAKD